MYFNHTMGFSTVLLHHARGPEAVFLSLQPSQAKEEETFLLLSVPPEVKES